MARFENEQQAMQVPLPDFPREVPDVVDAERLADQVKNNQQLLFLRAGEFGLDQDRLQQLQQQPVVVAPFVSPSPLSTVFGGSIENFRSSVAAGNVITDKIRSRGLPASQYAAVYLAMTEVPRKGAEAMDALIVPKNKVVNQRLLLTGKPEHGQAYATLSISKDAINLQQKAARDAFNQYLERRPELRKGGKGRQLLEALLADMQKPFGEQENLLYLDYAIALNKLMAERAGVTEDLPSTCVDTTVYTPFMRDVVTNPAQFTRKMVAAGFPAEVGFAKVVDERGLSQILTIKDIAEEDVVLAFRNGGKEVSYRSLQQSGADIAPCKELSYIMCMANMVPVVYGSQNSGDYYAPYAKTRQRVDRLGFAPTMYRTQPQIPDGYEQIGTVFDFYREALYPEEGGQL